MKLDEIKQLILTELPDSEVSVSGDGYHYQIRVINTIFENQKTVQRQQKIYAALNAPITDGRLHAVSITALTPEEARDG